MNSLLSQSLKIYKKNITEINRPPDSPESKNHKTSGRVPA